MKDRLCEGMILNFLNAQPTASKTADATLKLSNGRRIKRTAGLGLFVGLKWKRGDEFFQS